MHVVVNHLTFDPTTDWSKLGAAVEQFQASVAGKHPGFLGVSLVREAQDKGIFLVLFQDMESLNDFSRNVAAPWFTERFKPYLAGPVDRHVGKIVAGDMGAGSTAISS